MEFSGGHTSGNENVFTSKFLLNIRMNMKGFVLAFTDRLSDRIFVMIKNVQFKLQKRNIKFKSLNNQIQVLIDNELWTTHRSRTHLYTQGLKHRGSSIGKSYLLEFIDFESGDFILDCGANMGDLQLWFRNQNLDIQYIGIEPNPVDFDCLIKNVIGNQVPLNLALWNVSGQLKFWVDSKSASSSLIEPPVFTEVITVRSVRLDELELPQRIKLLKVEGEGAEPEILYGARNILSRVEWISVDVGPERGIEQTSTREDVVNFLSKNNFQIEIENPYHRKTILFKRIESWLKSDGEIRL
jgi:FkbM family methyltransferase